MATLYTLTLTGAWHDPMIGPPKTIELLRWLFDPALLARGLPYSLCMMLILGAHEMGHYLACRYYGVAATLPFFLPGLPLAFGTFGAFIRIREPIPTRKALFDIGVAGPLAGFAMILPVLIYAAFTAEPLPVTGAGMRAGEPLLLFWFLTSLAPIPPEGHSVYLTGPLMAAWVGCLVTAMNLFPVGQLDGGHICHAISTKAHRVASLMTIMAFVGLGVLAFPGWLVFATMIVMFGRRHPPVINEAAPLGRARLAVAFIALLVFALCFIPVPFSV